MAPDLPINLAPSAGHYTKRLIRSGYVNVFDVARRRWEAYFVTPDGFFFKLLKTSGITPVIPKKPFNCPDEGHRTAASCITVTDPANASTVWIGFSDVLWTDAVRRKNEDANYRRRHMVEIDVKAALKGIKKDHESIVRLSSVVAEYAMAPTEAKKAFEGSPFAFQPRQRDTARFKRECEAMRPGCGLIVTLADPAGLTRELASLMRCKTEAFVNQRPNEKRKLAASMAIDQIKTAVQTQVEDREIVLADEIADQRMLDDPIGHWISSSARAKTEKIRTIEPAQLERVSHTAWIKYDQKFYDKSRVAWLESFKVELERYDINHISPLAEAHIAWMRSSSLTAYFECNFDQNNIESGKTYAVAVSHCILATQDKKACSDLYTEWLGGDIADSKNLLLRAMVLNQSPAIEAIKDAVSASADPRQIPWDNLFSIHDAAVGRLNRDAQDIAAGLMAQISGPVARAFNKVLDGSVAFRGAIMASGLISGHPIVICQVTGSKKRFLELLVRQLVRSNSNQITEPELKRAVKAQLKRLQVHGVQMEGEARKTWVIVADKDVIQNMPAGLSSENQAKWLAKSIRTVDSLNSLNLERWRNVVNKNAPKFMTALVQAVCLTKIWTDEQKTLAHDKRDATGRLYGGIASLLSTTAEAIGGVAESRAAQGLRFGQGFVSRTGALLQLSGRIGGICAGLTLAVLDGVKAGDAKAENQMGLAWLYAGSAVIGFSLALALAFPFALGAAAIPAIGLLFILAIALGFIIDRLKDNSIQDWLERCPWGILEGKRYPDMDIEQSELAKAIK